MPAKAPGSELFRIADMHKLRIYVHVPEAYAVGHQPGLEVGAALRRAPAQDYTAETVRTSNALDPDAANFAGGTGIGQRQRRSFPGSYAEVHFKLPASRNPASAGQYRAVSRRRPASRDGRTTTRGEAQEHRPGA